MLCYELTMDKHHFGALFKDQVCDATVCKGDSHKVFRFKAEHLYYVKNNSVRKCIEETFS